jgi:hypothetical protein
MYYVSPNPQRLSVTADGTRQMTVSSASRSEQYTHPQQANEEEQNDAGKTERRRGWGTRQCVGGGAASCKQPLPTVLSLSGTGIINNAAAVRCGG